MARERNYADDVARWLGTTPGTFEAPTTAQVLQLAYEKSQINLPGNAARQQAMWEQLLNICGYKPRQRKSHGDAPRVYWQLCLPGNGTTVFKAAS